jgi:NAD(P) transhydrogenase subunit alpha
MLTTAAGTVRPSKVLIVGAGVQAAGDHDRALAGAQVEGFDVRPETKEQIQSLARSTSNWASALPVPAGGAS